MRVDCLLKLRTARDGEMKILPVYVMRASNRDVKVRMQKR